MLLKFVYLYEFMHDWQKLNETPEKEDFYSHLNMEDIIDANYTHAKRVCKDFEIKKIRRISWLLCWNEYIIVRWCIWELLKYVPGNIWAGSCKMFFSSWIRMATSFKKTKVKTVPLTDINILLILEKGIRGGICYSVSRYAKANKKYMKDYDKNKEFSYLQY